MKKSAKVSGLYTNDKGNQMKKLLIFVFLFLLGLGADAVFAQDYSTFKLDNGQIVIIKEVHDNPIVTIDTWIKTGSVNENDKNNGVAHFLEHLFFKGTQKHPAGDFDKLLESKGAMTNAATSKDFTHYYITIPSRDFKTAMDLHADMLLHPQIPRKELEKERKVVLEEIAKNNDQPETKLYENMNKEFYSTHPYKRSVIGKKSIIETITREEILDFYNTWYNPSNMITVIVGDVDTQTALDSVKSEFGKNSAVRCKLPIYKMDKSRTQPVRVIVKDKIKNAYMLIGFRGVSAQDLKDMYALDVLGVMMGDGRSSKLYQSVKEQKQLAYSISAGHASMKDDSLFVIRANFVPQNLEKLEKAIFDEIAKVRNGNFDEQDILTAKRIIERDTFYARESTANIANELGYTTLVYNNPQFYDNYIAGIQKVTKSDLLHVAKKYLNPNYSVVSIILPDGFDDKTKEISNVTKKEAKLIKTDKNITKYELPNKATLIINHNTLNDIVAFQVFAKGGNFLEKKTGAASMTAMGMMKGTKKYTLSDLSQIMEQNGIKISPNASGDYFTISVKTTKNDLGLTFDLLNELVNNASFDPQVIEQIKTEKIYAIRQMRDNPSSAAFEDFKTQMWKNTAYGVTGTILEKTLPALSRADILEYYNTVFFPENLVISVNGNVDDQKMIEYFSNIFSGTKGEKFDYKAYEHQFKPLSTTTTYKDPKESESSWLILGWLTDGVTNKKDAAVLQVIDSLLGSGMSSRLFNHLRDEQGLAYQIGSTYSGNIDKGVFAVYIGTNPNTALHSKKELLGQIDILKKEFVSDKELREAKDKIMGNFILAQETNTEKANALGVFEASGRGFEYINEFPSLIESVSASDIIRIANKYFESPYMFVIVAPQKTLTQF